MMCPLDMHHEFRVHLGTRMVLFHVLTIDYFSTEHWKLSNITVTNALIIMITKIYITESFHYQFNLNF